jgi:hypothetical protein
MVLGRGHQVSGVNVDETGYPYTDGKFRFGFGSDEDQGGGGHSLHLSIGDTSGSVLYMSGGTDTGSCGYDGDRSKNNERDTNAVLWVK